jgi:uncharacterized lipoprotein YehR (DUF1307 family)
MEEKEELIKREDIEYSKILMFQLNTIRELQTFIFDGGTSRTNVKTFINSVNALRSLLIPYIDDKEVKRININEINANCNQKEVMKIYDKAQNNFEILMKIMHKKNLLLERFSEIEM